MGRGRTRGLEAHARQRVGRHAIQRVTEGEGRLTLLDQSRVMEPHPAFRLFATANTVGLGDATGLYHGTQQINQGQMDRWNIVATLNYLPHEDEVGIVLSKSPSYDNEAGRKTIKPEDIRFAAKNVIRL